MRVDLPLPDTPVTQVNVPQRNFGRDILQVMTSQAPLST